MAVKYVKDFAYDSGFGFTGSSGKMPVKSHMRSPMKKGIGGGVKAGPKAPSIAPAMVEKRSQGLGGLAPETKKLAAYDKPHMAGKKGAKVAQYAKGGAVKGKKKMPSFLKAKMMKKADGGEIDPGMLPQAPPDDASRYLPATPPPGARVNPNYGQPGQAYYILDDEREGMSETRGGPGVAISPLNRAAAITAARNMAMRPNTDLMRRARQEMAARRPMPTRRAMPVAPKAPMIAGRRPMPVASRMARPSMMLNPRLREEVPMYAKGGAVKKGQAKIGKVMGEFKRGELHSGSKKGPVVTNPKQAKAIALSEARAAGAKIPKKAMGGKACG